MLPARRERATFREFVVFTVERSGSTNLIEALHRHPNVVAGGELLNPDEPMWAGTGHGGMPTAELLRAGFAANHLRATRRRIDAIGFKVVTYQVEPGSRHGRALELLQARNGLH